MSERLDEAELRRRFRLSIPHAGPDPAYALRPSSRFAQQQERQQERARQERQGFSSLLSPSSTSSQFSAGFSAAVGDDASVPPPPQQQEQQEQQDEEGEAENGKGGREGYAEPAYITRQRCLVLNDWALSLFEGGEYAKVCGRKKYDGSRLR